MKRYNYCIFSFQLLFFLVVNACTIKQSNENVTTIIVSDTIVKPISISMFIDSIEVFPLKLDSVTKYIDFSKYIVANNHVYVLDKKLSKSVHIYELSKTSNTYVGAIGKNTTMPELKSFSPMDISIDPQSKNLEILELPNKIHVFTFRGNYIHTKKIPFQTISFFKIDSSNVWYYNNFFENNFYFSDYRNYNLVLQRNHTKFNQFLPYNTQNITPKTTPFSNSNFFVSPTGFFFLQKGNNTVYKLSKESAIPFLKVDFESKNLPLQITENLNSKDSLLWIIQKPEYRSLQEFFFNTDDFLLLDFIEKNRSYCYYYDKKSKTGFTIKEILNDISDIPLFNFSYSDSTSLYALLDNKFLTTSYTSSNKKKFKKIQQLSDLYEKYPNSNLLLKMNVKK